MTGPLPVRYKRLKEALAVDRVLSVPQVEHHFHLRRGDLARPFVVLTTRLTTISKSLRSTQVVGFVALDPRVLLTSTEDQLAHLAGTAELRLRLDARPDAWRSDADALSAGNVPDAIWQHPDYGPVAIEYDAGSYLTGKVRAKLTAFQAYRNVIWGASSERRLRRLARQFPDPNVVYTHAPWWAPGRAGVTLVDNRVS